EGEKSTEHSGQVAFVEGRTGLAMHSLRIGIESEEQEARESNRRRTEERVIARRDAALAKLVKNPRPVVVDDFHRISTVETKQHILSSVKPALSRGSTLVCISVPEEVESIIGRTPQLNDLNGRYRLARISNWTKQSIIQIANEGFPVLTLSIAKPTINALYRNSHKN